MVQLECVWHCALSPLAPLRSLPRSWVLGRGSPPCQCLASPGLWGVLAPGSYRARGTAHPLGAAEGGTGQPDLGCDGTKLLQGSCGQFALAQKADLKASLK